MEYSNYFGSKFIKLNDNDIINTETIQFISKDHTPARYNSETNTDVWQMTIQFTDGTNRTITYYKEESFDNAWEQICKVMFKIEM